MKYDTSPYLLLPSKDFGQQTNASSPFLTLSLQTMSDQCSGFKSIKANPWFQSNDKISTIMIPQY